MPKYNKAVNLFQDIKEIVMFKGILIIISEQND